MRIVNLGDIATYINGYAFKPTDWETEGLPIIRIQNLNNPKQEFNYFNGDISDKYIVRNGDILISWSASIGVFEWDREDAVLNQHIFKVVFDKEKINKTYFKFMVSIALNKAMQYMHGSTMKHITKGYFDAIPVPVPGLETQEIIAQLLEKSQQLINTRKKQIQACEELIKSQFIEMFGDSVANTKGWEVKDLGELGYFKNGMNYRQSDSGYPIKFLGVGEFKYGNCINTSAILPVLELQEEPNEEYLLKTGDVVFVRSNGSKELVGRSVLIRELEEATTYSGFCIRYRNQCPDVLPDFLIHLFSDESFKQMLKKDSRGANINNLNQQMLSSLKIIMPPIELQSEFAQFVQQVDKLKFKMEQSLIELENNFNSLMQRVFKGELF